jgi:hypothetical protein
MNMWKTLPWLGALVVVLLGARLNAANWGDAAAELAREIAGVTGPGAIVLSVHNASSLSAEDTRGIQRALEASLRSHGVRVGDAGAATSEVSVTLSENLQGYLWVAAIQQGTETRVVMHAGPHAQPAPAARPTATAALRKTLLWSQPERILDALALNADGPDPRLVILDGEKASVLRLHEGHWASEQSFAVAHAQPFPRDLRGRLAAASGHLFDAYLPGVLCNATDTAMNCHDQDEPWPLQPGFQQTANFNPARNFFTGALTPGIGQKTATAPFLAAAAVPRASYTLWLFAGVDGRVRASDGINEIALNLARDWGDNIAAVKSACGTMVLADSKGDDPAHDTIIAYEIADREPAAVTPPLELPGAVSALWTAGDGSSATAVIQNGKNNLYEAYSLAVTCQ